jgi:hypothetical protein
MRNWLLGGTLLVTRVQKAYEEDVKNGKISYLLQNEKEELGRSTLLIFEIRSRLDVHGDFQHISPLSTYRRFNSDSQKIRSSLHEGDLIWKKSVSRYT